MKPAKDEPDWADQIGTKAARKVKARKVKARKVKARKVKARKSTSGVWFGLGMMGLIGWSVVVPTLLGAALGIWLDKHHPGKHAWTLALLVVGLAIGCLNAWHWVANEDKAMRDGQENSDE